MDDDHPRTLLIAYDGSEGARAAITRAGRLLPGADATVLTVGEPLLGTLARAGAMGATVGMAVSGRDWDQVDAAPRRLARAHAADGVRRAEAVGLPARASAVEREDGVASMILTAAEDAQADLIVLGTRTRSRFGMRRLGGVSHEVLQRAARPVLAVPTAQAGGLGAPAGPATVVVAYDGSHDARTALQAAAELLPGARVLVVCVWEPALASLTRSGSVGLGSPGSWGDADLVDATSAQAAEDVAAEGVELAEASGLVAEGLALPRLEDVPTTLLAAADEAHADLVVVGSRGHGAVASFLMGAVSERLVRHADRPVLVVPGSSVAARRRELADRLTTTLL